MTTHEIFLKERQELKVIENHLIELIAKTNYEILQNLFLDFMSKRNDVNEAYLKYMNELLTKSTEPK